MTSLAVIFILLLCASLNNAQNEGETMRNSMLVEVQKELKTFLAGGVEVSSDPKDPLGLLILVPEDLLAFPFDRAEISYAGETFLRAFVPRLARTICSARFASEIHSIIVEGHTDSSGKDEYNWDLSQRRSMSVVRTSLAVLATQDTAAERSAFLRLLSASGRGSADLVSNTAGQENAAMSRRVVFKIKVRSIEQKTVTERLAPTVTERPAPSVTERPGPSVSRAS
jgi:outer membrane protein OmpA-like peptidoglycan-associated protein